ncbi:MAG TPA: glycosyltransferase family A protein [Solirubrobacteraceae bacterium]|nr:glycosyltransferase family A protein [Solirubrobacteraceae bacterium]
MRGPRTGLAAAPESSSSRPTVSVIVPCYNYGHVLEGCVASVLAQEGVDVRLLIIDDRSTDGSADVGLRLSESDDRVEFRVHRENIGLIGTANEGLRWAEGEYVVLLSADDLLVRHSLHRATAVMANHPNVGMVYGRPILAREDRAIPTLSGRWRATDLWSGANWIRRRCRSAHNCISSPEVVVRNSVQQAVGGYDPACQHTSDLNMWLRIAAVADIAYVRGVPQAIYRVHANSMLRTKGGPLVALGERRAAFERFFASCASTLDQPERLQAAVGRALARQALWKASRAVDRGIEPSLVEELTAFALDVCPDTRRLREWHGLRLRQRIGAGRSLSFPPFIATGAAHRLRYHASQMLWRQRGI